MSNDVNVTVKVNAEMDKAIAGAKTLKDLLTQSAEAANSTAKSMASIAKAQTAKPASQTKAYTAAAKGATTPDENLNYGIARSVSVGTGAAGRDFAKQAQGLGGLVHVYATFAANLFAVGAAFTALKNAADTSNMIKGLDQLGAASGRNLGGLSKEVVKITDGAVSLREAMEAVGKATSAGMSNENLKRMAAGAKNVSQALGVAMPDALSRLSRGISKIEPELLDELGIFVRVDKAAQEYARSLGKPISALTDFERRAGFANAVLDQMDQKFGKIKLEANPFDKLLAGLKDVAQVGLELVNKVVGPLVSLLASSPTGLAIAIGAVAAKLISMSVPAFNMMAKNRKQELADAKQFYIDKVELAEAASKEAANIAENTADLQMAQTDAHAKRLLASDENTLKKRSKIFQSTYDKVFDKLATGGGKDIGNADYADLDKKIASLEKSQAKGKISAAIVQEWKDAKTSLQAYVTAELKYRAEAELAAQAGPASSLSAAGVNAKNAKNLAAKALSAEISANAAYEASVNGIGVAWAKTREKIKEAVASGEMGKTRAGFTLLSSGIGAVTSRVSGLIGAFGMWGQVAAIALAGLNFMHGMLTKTARQSEEFSTSLDTLESSTKHLATTFEYASSLDPVAQVSTESLAAKATAIYELSQAMEVMTKKAIALQEATNLNWFDKENDKFLDSIDLGIADKAAKTLTESMTSAFEKLADDPKAKKAAEEIASTLGLKDLKDKSLVDNALEKTFKDTPALFEQIAKKVSKVGNTLMVSAQAGVELKKSLEEGAKKLTDFTNSFIPQDKFSLLGSSMMVEATRATLALEQGPIQALASMRDMVSDPKFLTMFPPEVAQNLISYKKKIDEASDALAIHAKRLTDLREGRSVLDEMSNGGKNKVVKGINIEAAKKQIDEQIDLEIKSKTTIDIDISKMNKDFDEAITKKFIYGANIVGSRIAAEWAKVGSATTGVLLSVLGDTKEAASMRARMEQTQLGAQSAALKMQERMVKELFRNTEELKKSTATAEIDRLERKAEKGPLTEEDSNSLKSAEATLKASKGNLSNAGKRLSDDTLYSLLEQKEITSDLISLNQNLSSIQAQMAQLADQMGASQLTERLKTIQDEYAVKLKLLEIGRSTAALELEGAQIVKLPTEFLSQEIVRKEALLKLELATYATKKSELEMEGKLATVREAMKVATGKNLADLTTRLTRIIKEDMVQESIVNTQKDYTAALNVSLEVAQKIYDINVLDLKVTQDKAKHALDMQKERLNTEKARSDAQKQSGVEMPETFNIEEEYRIKYQMLKLEEETQIQAIEFAKQDFNLKSQLIQDQYRLIKVQAEASKAELRAKATVMKTSADTAKTPEEKKAFNNAATALGAASGEYDKVTASADAAAASAKIAADQMLRNFDEQIQRQKQLTAEKKKTLDIEKESAMANARLVELASNLGGAFGASAGKFMPLIESFSRLAASSNLSKDSVDALNIRQEELVNTNTALSSSNTKLQSENEANTAALTSMDEATRTSAEGRMQSIFINDRIIKNNEKMRDNSLQMAKNAEEIGDFENKQAKLTESNNARQLAGTMKVISSAKLLFKEKSTGYKVITAIEKAYTLFKLTSNALEMASNIKKTIVDTGESAKRNATTVLEATYNAGAAVIKAIASMPFPLNIAAGVATAAVVYALLRGIGGKGGSDSGGGGSFTANSEQKQAISGSGMSYNEEGKLVENGGGVFGDASAQSETVAKSIEILKENSIDGLQYDNKMLKALERMANSLDSAAKGIYNIPGLRQGSAFTAIPESTEGYGEAFYGKFSHASAWGKLAKVTGDPIAGFISNLGNTILNGLFGGKQSVSTKLVAAGVQLKGTMIDLSNGADEAIRAYNDIKITTKTDGGWFGKDKTSVKNKRVTQSIEEDTREAIADVFTQTRELFNLLGKEVGYTSTQVDESLATINASADIDVKGLSGSQILEQINYVTSGIIDNAASVVFESLAQFREFGEAMGETAVRVVRDTQLVKQSLKNIGMEDLIKSITDSGLEESQIKLRAIEISEGLIDMAGGLDTFLEHVETYRENFLTDTERLAPIKKNVSDVMSELATEYPEIGIATVNTRHEFKQLVSALDVTTVKGMALFTSLMDVAEGFDQVMDASDELASKVKLAGADFASLMTEAIMGKSTAEDIGKKVSASIQEGILQAISSAYIESISTAISEQLIMPLIVSISDSAISGAAVTAVITQSTIDNIITMATNAATAIEVIFGNADFQATLATISTTITTAMTAMRRPAVDAAADLGKFGLAASNFASVLKDGILGNISAADVGEKIATIIEEGILNALTTSAIDSITNIITQQIITPIITSITTGAAISATVSQASLNAVVDTAVAASRTLAAVFANEEFVETIKTISTVTGETFAQMSGAAQITSGSITKVLDKLGDANTRMINAYKAQTTALESARQKFASFASSLREFAASLRLSELSPLTPAQKYAQAREEFDRTASLAQAGDETALGKLQEVSRTFLDISRSFYASSAPYTSDFDRVQAVLDSSASAAEALVADIDVQIGIAREQLTALGDISTAADNILTEIQKANLALEEAKKAATTTVADTLVTSFTMLDKNIDGLLTTDELGALGLATDGELSNIFKALDTDNNGSISLLESLNSASRDVSIAVRSLNPLLTDIRTGNRSIEEYTAYLESINSSLTASSRDSLGNTDIISRYADMFSRAPDQAGLDYWSQSMANGTATPDNITQHMFTAGEGVSPGASGAWLTRYIQQGYSEILGRPAEPAGLEYWKQQATSGRVALSDLYKTIAYAGASDTSRPEAASALDWLNRNPNYIGRFAAGGTHASGARIVGEQGPELEVTGPARLWSATQTRNMLRPAPVESSSDAELLAEIRKLNAKIDSLERTVATGDMINADATERNTKVVSNSVKDSTTTSIHASRMQKKAAIS